MGRSLWREVESVVYNYCWRSPAQSFLGPSPVGLATILYCLRFETSLSVTTYDSQGHSGGTWPRFHTWDWMNSRSVLPITPRQWSRRKHCSSLLKFNRCLLWICCLLAGVVYRVIIWQRVCMLQYRVIECSGGESKFLTPPWIPQRNRVWGFCSCVTDTQGAVSDLQFKC
jgi:hypothetical protein